jgi:hypothetical protein
MNNDHDQKLIILHLKLDDVIRDNSITKEELLEELNEFKDVVQSSVDALEEEIGK